MNCKSRLPLLPAYWQMVAVALIYVLGCDRQGNHSIGTTATSTDRERPKELVQTFATLPDVEAALADSLRAVERKYGFTFPAEYRDFILQHNGGFPSRDCILVTESGRETAADLFCFFAIGERRAWASVEWHYETFAGRLPPSTVPVARDSCGNLWLLCVSQNEFGSVYFWDHGSYQTFDETDLSNWPRVATSFAKFLGQLRSYQGDATDSVVPSRYRLVQQAIAGIIQNDASFVIVRIPIMSGIVNAMIGAKSRCNWCSTKFTRLPHIRMGIRDSALSTV